MKAHELLNSPETWCKESPAADEHGNKLQAFDPRAVNGAPSLRSRKPTLHRNGAKRWTDYCAPLDFPSLDWLRRTELIRRAPYWSGTTILKARSGRSGKF